MEDYAGLAAPRRVFLLAHGTGLDVTGLGVRERRCDVLCGWPCALQLGSMAVERFLFSFALMTTGRLALSALR
ncbi:MAG: hypothetical protein ACKPKO_01655, partial [Candidatus Fonsibacter sp.]